MSGASKIVNDNDNSNRRAELHPVLEGVIG